MLCFGAKGMDHVIRESCYKGRNLQRNYSHSMVKNILEPKNVHYNCR